MVGAAIASMAASAPVPTDASDPTTRSECVLARLALVDGEQPVLRGELLLCSRVPERDAPDQRRVAGLEEVVGVDGEMGPGEGADAEVDDGGRARRGA